MEKKSNSQSPIIELVQGDITTLSVDAIVNAANKHLQHGGGVAAAIVRRGGEQIQTESNALIAKLGPLNTGEAVSTSAGGLPSKYVIHTVGPIWGEGDEDRKLRSAIVNSLKLADKRGLKTVAFPAVSAGIYHFPLDRCARILVESAKEYLKGTTGLTKVVFCLFDKKTFKAFEQAQAALM